MSICSKYRHHLEVGTFMTFFGLLTGYLLQWINDL